MLDLVFLFKKKWLKNKIRNSRKTNEHRTRINIDFNDGACNVNLKKNIQCQNIDVCNQFIYFIQLSIEDTT